MTPVHRWSAVVAGAALLLAAPWAVRALPVDDPGTSATELLTQVRRAQDSPYSGYVESRGALQLPVGDRFTDVGALFGERTRMRVWWRDEHAWRVDELLAAGEVDLVGDERGTTRWRYEQDDVERSPHPAVRLPRTADLLPPAVARLLLEDVDADDVERIAARRVAGVDAPGLRLVPGTSQSSIAHVDLWADPGSGLVLRVDVVARGDDEPAFTSQFLDFSSRRPPTDRVRFEPPPGAALTYDNVLDIADAANQYSPFLPPDDVAGLRRSPAPEVRGVGVYGSGLTRLLAVPLLEREAQPLREQLAVAPGAQQHRGGVIVTTGPLRVMLTGEEDDSGWLVAGTVTRPTVVQAARDLTTRAFVVSAVRRR